MAPKTAGKTLPKTLYKIRGECAVYVERSKSETSLCDSCIMWWTNSCIGAKPDKQKRVSIVTKCMNYGKNMYEGVAG
ncbi:MAG: hypothetical protein Pg6A_19670 [Termitinemataceae bacterium]|nr:MAG: hypothetical protein Pg6A_19670 [Termitinemataceae bacterium]